MQDVCDGLSDGSVQLAPLNVDNYEFVYEIFQEEVKTGADSAFYINAFRSDSLYTESQY